MHHTELTNSIREVSMKSMNSWRTGLFVSVLAAAGMAAVIGSSLVLAQGGGRDGWGGCCDFWQPGWMHRHMWDGQGGDAEMRARMARHRAYMHEGAPEPYRGAVSTVKATPETLEAGGRLYTTHCISCHGKSGMGDGAAAKGLSPSPALLAYMIERPVAVDEYLLWTISEGGKTFGTDMPTFKHTLKTEEIWRIIVYMRAGFPKVASKE